MTKKPPNKPDPAPKAPPSHFKIEAALYQAIGQYLATRPYREVAGLIQRLDTTAVPIHPTPPKPPLNAPGGPAAH